MQKSVSEKAKLGLTNYHEEGEVGISQLVVDEEGGVGIGLRGFKFNNGQRLSHQDVRGGC